MEKQKPQGITLIALVISVVILLILSGISIYIAIGNNGIVTQASNSIVTNRKENAKEVVAMAWASAKAKYWEEWTQNSSKVLKDYLVIDILNPYVVGEGIFTSVVDNNDGTWTLKYKANDQEITYIFIITEDGVITFSSQSNLQEQSELEDSQEQSQEQTLNQNTASSLMIGEVDINTISDFSSLYGQLTNFQSVDGIEWQLFWVDDNNYYLIASDYVPNNLLPCNGNDEFGVGDLMKSTMEDNNFKNYCVKFCSNSSTNDYVATNTKYSLGAKSDVILNHPLVPNYLKWVGSSVNTIDSFNNMKATAFMLDKDNWSSFAGNIENAYAIGGPTCEMFTKSYNSYSAHTTKLGNYDQITSDNADGCGYRFKYGDSEWNDDEADGMEADSNNMWVIADTDNAAGFWLASPGSFYGNCQMYVHYSGSMSKNWIYTGWIGIRPVVVIPKSSI